MVREGTQHLRHDAEAVAPVGVLVLQVGEEAGHQVEPTGQRRSDRQRERRLVVEERARVVRATADASADRRDGGGRGHVEQDSDLPEDGSRLGDQPDLDARLGDAHLSFDEDHDLVVAPPLGEEVRAVGIDDLGEVGGQFQHGRHDVRSLLQPDVVPHTAMRRVTIDSAAIRASSWPVTAARKSSRSSANSTVSESAVMVAVRGTSRRRPISPKKSPATSCRISWSPWETATEPDWMMKNRSETWPSVMIVDPAGISKWTSLRARRSIVSGASGAN